MKSYGAKHRVGQPYWMDLRSLLHYDKMINMSWSLCADHGSEESVTSVGFVEREWVVFMCNILASSHHVQILHLFKESGFFVCIGSISCSAWTAVILNVFFVVVFFLIREDRLEGQVVRVEAAYCFWHFCRIFCSIHFTHPVHDRNVIAIKSKNPFTQKMCFLFVSYLCIP